MCETVRSAKQATGPKLDALRSSSTNVTHLAIGSAHGGDAVFVVLSDSRGFMVMG